MLTHHRTLIRQGEDLFEVIQDFRIEYFYNDERVFNQDLFDKWKTSLGTDIVLKNESKFFFCEKVDELEFEMIGTEIVPVIEA